MEKYYSNCELWPLNTHSVYTTRHLQIRDKNSQTEITLPLRRNVILNGAKLYQFFGASDILVGPLVAKIRSRCH